HGYAISSLMDTAYWSSELVWKLVRCGISKGLDMAYLSFLEHGYVVFSLMDTAYWSSE
ncbi:hypothetical protein Tco_1007903, partial [Tanacetum coccineum]